jgi:hypothetical protein
MSQRKIGDYLVLNPIGHGSQATVYRVQDSRTGQIRALKELHPHRVGTPTPWSASAERQKWPPVSIHLM